MIAEPLWEPYVRALLKKQFGMEVGDTAIPGWILFAVGVGLHLANRYEQRHPIIPVESKRDSRRERDIRTLRRVLETIHTPTFDEFLEYGKTSLLLGRIFHFWEGFHHLMGSADFFMSDDECLRLIVDLHDSWGTTLDFGEWFTNTSNSDLYKFDHRHGLHPPGDVQKAHKRFISSIWRAESALRAVLQYVFKNYPETDTELTNSIAWREYVEFQRKMDGRMDS